MEGFEFHDAAEGFDAFDLVWHGDVAAVECEPVCGGLFGEVGDEVEVELGACGFCEAVGFWEVGAVVDPEDGDVWLCLGGEVEDDGFVGAEVGGDDGAALGACDGPCDELGCGEVLDFGVECVDLLWRHGTGSLFPFFRYGK